MNSNQLVDHVFSPYAPITDENYCYGRQKEIKQIHQSILAEGKHIVLFGERGIGKTSLANVAYKKLDERLAITVVSSRLLDRPAKIWQEVIGELVLALENQPNFSQLGLPLEQVRGVMTEKSFGLNQLIHLFSRMKAPLLIVLDEVDLLAGEKNNLIFLAETIKAFSDRVPQVTLLLVGIANNANELVAEHISLERCLIEIKTDRMEKEELRDILEGGLMKLNLNMLEEVKQKVIEFSEGLPFYIHLLAKEILTHAQELKYRTAVKSNFQFAIKKIIEDRSHTLENSYFKATVYSKNGFYEKVLMACVDYANSNDLADQKQAFKVADIASFLKRSNISCNLRTVQNYLNKICEPTKGEILKKTTLPRGYQFSFRNPLIKEFICNRVRNQNTNRVAIG